MLVVIIIPIKRNVIVVPLCEVWNVVLSLDTTIIEPGPWFVIIA